MSERAELLLRIAVFLPLVLITWQVLRLRQIMRSPAWGLQAAGFVLFCIVRAISLFWHAAPVTLLVALTFLGYALISLGLRRLRLDILIAMGVKHRGKP